MNNWQTKKLGDIVEITSGTWGPADNQGTAVLRSTNFTNEGNLLFDDIAYREVPENKISELNLKKGDILLEKSGGSPAQPVGRVVFFDKEQEENIVFGNFISRLRPTGINNKFVFYFLLYLYKKGYTNRLQNQTTGIRNLIVKKYLDIKVPLPTITVQQQIVEKLDAIRKLQELNQKEIEKTEELLRTQLNKEFVEADNWQGQKIKNVSLDIITGKTPSTQNKDYFMAEISWATPGDFDENRMWVESTKRKISQLAIDKGIVKLVPKKSLMVVCIGATIGKIGLTFYEMATNQQINSIVFDEKKILPEFGFYYFHRDKRLITKQAKQTTLPILNKGLTGELIIKYPDMEIQRQIVNRLNAIYSHKVGLFLQGMKLTELFESTLNKVMKGELIN